MIYTIPSIRDLKLKGQSVFIRVDFNVPLKDGVITDDSRITEALPTIKYAILEGAKVVLGSHLGRPDGERKSEFSMEPVALHLASLLNQDVTLAQDCVGEGIEMMVKSLKNGSVLLLENLRFYKEEEANDPEFSKKLSRLCSIYVNDAFGTAHRKHASTYGMATLAPIRAMGFLIEKELKFVGPLVSMPAKPFGAILGGSKVSDKIKTIEALMSQVQLLCIGGAMAHAFDVAMGKTIAPKAKPPKTEEVEAARRVLSLSKSKEIPVYLPVDTNEGFDIGRATVQLFAEKLSVCKTIFWNGPLGWFENPPYNFGTFKLAELIADYKAIKVVGGGDTVSALKLSGFASKFDHLSTGGGAVLEFIEKGSLPGIDILQTEEKRQTDESQHLSRERVVVKP